MRRCANSRHVSAFGPTCCIQVPAQHKIGAMESLMAVLINLLRTLDRAGESDVLPNRHRNTAFRVTSGPGREKYWANTNTNWNSWNTVSVALVVGFFDSGFFSRNIYSAISSRQRSWFFLLVQRLSTNIKAWDYYTTSKTNSTLDGYLPIRINASLAHCGKSDFLGFLLSDKLISRLFIWIGFVWTRLVCCFDLMSN